MTFFLSCLCAWFLFLFFWSVHVGSSCVCAEEGWHCLYTIFVHFLAASVLCVISGECMEGEKKPVRRLTSVCECVCVCDYLSPPALAFAERRSKSFSRSWSDPTPVKTDSPHEPRDSELTRTNTCACMSTRTHRYTYRC